MISDRDVKVNFNKRRNKVGIKYFAKTFLVEPPYTRLTFLQGKLKKIEIH